jgi:hypothetical protein
MIQKAARQVNMGRRGMQPPDIKAASTAIASGEWSILTA